MVTPVAKTGLHCGSMTGCKFWPSLAGDPGREDRAPLRQLAARHGFPDAEVVTPVAKTGLHCGEGRSTTAVAERVRVTPVAKTGLHCGADDFAARQAVFQDVTPVAKTGLHCGQIPPGVGPYDVGRDPGREDRAPLRLKEGAQLTGIGELSDPGREDRAPLRLRTTGKGLSRWVRGDPGREDRAPLRPRMHRAHLRQQRPG